MKLRQEIRDIIDISYTAAYYNGVDDEGYKSYGRTKKFILNQALDAISKAFLGRLKKLEKFDDEDYNNVLDDIRKIVEEK